MAHEAGRERGEPRAILRNWLAVRSGAEAVESFFADAGPETFEIKFAIAPRVFGHRRLVLAVPELAEAEAARPGWRPVEWTLCDAARILLLLEWEKHDPNFPERLRDLFSTADVMEAVSILRGLPLYADAEAHEQLAAEGLRTNAPPVFSAVAHHSPYPREVFCEDRWNQMILKAVFIGASLDAIEGLNERANAPLASMLIDYARERWAAGRRVEPALWICVLPFRDEFAGEIEAALALASPQERARAPAELTGRHQSAQGG